MTFRLADIQLPITNSGYYIDSFSGSTGTLWLKVDPDVCPSPTLPNTISFITDSDDISVFIDGNTSPDLQYSNITMAEAITKVLDAVYQDAKDEDGMA